MSLVTFMIRRFRQRKNRVRVTRQLHEEQRSMGSIGYGGLERYIDGSVNYIGGGSMSMDYPFDGHPGHYQLWKPPNGYFPRGEAPPPYEEAVASAQAESMNAQCTVSVATTTHRSLPLTICQNENNCELPSNITSTTNLINININNSGTLTTVAAGENHLVNASKENNNNFSCSNPTNQLTNTIASTSSSNHLKSSSTDLLSQSEVSSRVNSLHCQSFKNNNQTVAEQNQRPLTDMIVTDFQPSEYRVIECNYTNCTYDKNGCCTSSNRPLVTNHSSLPRDYDPFTYANCSDDVAKLTSDVASFAAILPPPLFDESNRSADNVGSSRSSEIGSSSSKIASSRRHHRTIPRRFATTESIAPTSSIKTSKSQNDSSAEYSSAKASSNSSSSNHKTNGKPICQCPVQHVPMSYMGASHFTPTIRQNPPTDIYMPAMSTKVISSKPRSSRTPRHSSDNKDNSCGTSGSACTDRCSQNGTLRSSKSSSGSGKIATISKKINSDALPKTESLPSTLIHPHHTSSAAKQNHVAALLDPLAVPNLRQHQKHHSSSSNTATSKHDASLSLGQHPHRLVDHPVLPPKLHRNRTSSHQPTLVPRIHTISKPAGDSIASSNAPVDPNSTSKSVSARTAFVVNHQQLSHHTKSLPRSAEDKLKFLQPVGGELQSSSDKAYSLGKINYTNSFPKFSNHYELPKAANGKISMISDVVSKVPSIINIPSPVNRAANALHAAIPSVVPSLPNMHSASFPSSPKFGLPHTTDQPSLIAINVKQSLHPAKQSLPPYPDHSQHRHAPVSLGATPAKRSNQTGTIAQDHRQPQSLPVCTTYKNCSNPKEHFLPNDTSIDDEYLSECENCKSAHGSRYYLDEPAEEQPQETMTLQRKIEDKQEDEQTYYRASSTLPTNTKHKQAASVKNREPWFSTIPASSSSDDEAV